MHVLCSVNSCDQPKNCMKVICHVNLTSRDSNPEMLVSGDWHVVTCVSKGHWIWEGNF
jgi:hypothetical protein